MNDTREDTLALFIKASMREMELASVVEKLSKELESVKEEKATLYSKYASNSKPAFVDYTTAK